MKNIIPAKGGYSHAYIIASPSLAGCEEAATRLASGIVCSGAERPCGSCPHCRKASAGIHPDITVVARETDDKGKPRREIYIEQIRRIVVDAHITPNEAAKRVFIIREADKMNLAAQNALLKILEEPPEPVAIILTVQSVSLLLPTVRSRCVLLETSCGAEAPGEESLVLASELLSFVNDSNRPGLIAFCMENGKLDSASALELVKAVRHLAAEMLRQDIGNRNGLYKITELMSECDEYLRRNVNVRHVMGYISVNLF